MEVMSLKSFIGGIHPKDQKQYTKDLPIIKIKAIVTHKNLIIIFN